MSLTPSYIFRGKTDCADCGKQMGINDTGIVYNIYTKTPREVTQDLMFCVPCALKITHAMVADLVKLGDREETFRSLLIRNSSKTNGIGLRMFAEIYKELSDKLNIWADTYDEVAGVTENAIRKQTKTL